MRAANAVRGAKPRASYGKLCSWRAIGPQKPSISAGARGKLAPCCTCVPGVLPLLPNAAYADKSYNVFLQGSYGNDTNIYAESDVDTVIRLNSTFRYNVDNLSPDQQVAFRQTFGGTPSYTFGEFKQGVITRLSNAFGTGNVKLGNKAINIKASGSRRSSDVVACYEYRRYIRFFSLDDYEYIPGIIFPTVSGGEIINFLKPHSDNCTTKHQATATCYKPMVRIVKNMRSRLVEENTITKDMAPSYYIEGLLYNVPNDKFGGTYGDTFCNCINWLMQTDRAKLKCANERYLLLGNSNVQWSSDKCDRFLNALVRLWQNW
jgi:hypothetical protein